MPCWIAPRVFNPSAVREFLLFCKLCIPCACWLCPKKYLARSFVWSTFTPLSPVMVEPLAPWLVWYPLELVAPLPDVPLSALKMPVPAFMRLLTPPSTFAPVDKAPKKAGNAIFKNSRGFVPGCLLSLVMVDEAGNAVHRHASGCFVHKVEVRDEVWLILHCQCSLHFGVGLLHPCRTQRG